MREVCTSITVVSNCLLSIYLFRSMFVNTVEKSPISMWPTSATKKHILERNPLNVTSVKPHMIGNINWTCTRKPTRIIRSLNVIFVRQNLKFIMFWRGIKWSTRNEGINAICASLQHISPLTWPGTIDQCMPLKGQKKLMCPIKMILDFNQL